VIHPVFDLPLVTFVNVPGCGSGCLRGRPLPRFADVEFEAAPPFAPVIAFSCTVSNGENVCDFMSISSSERYSTFKVGSGRSNSNKSCNPAGRVWTTGVSDPCLAAIVLGEHVESELVGDGESVKSFATPLEALVEADETEVEREPGWLLLLGPLFMLKPEELRIIMDGDGNVAAAMLQLQGCR
jgi:hypothetical protein